MSRKYIYIIVILLTLILVISEHYLDLKLSESTIVGKELESDTNNENSLLDDIYNSATLRSPLTIKNIQNDANDLTYTYKLKISDIKGAYKYIHNNKENYLVFTANGEAQITLKSNEFITIYDLPNDITYKIEQTNNVKDLYVTKINNEESVTAEGIISLDTTVTFSNEAIKPKEEVKDNPVTADHQYSIIFLSIYAALLYILIKKIKVKRYI